jgi:hypothetical protein
VPWLLGYMSVSHTPCTLHCCPGGPWMGPPHYEISPGGPPWWGLGLVPTPPGHRCDQTGLPVRPRGATFTGQPAGCSRYTAVTRNKPLDFERGRPFFKI